MTGMDDLATWLRTQLDDDERASRGATPGPWRVSSISEFGTADVEGITTAYAEPCCAAEDAEHIARWDPARVLTEVDAKRRILDLHSAEPGQHPDFCGHDMHELPCPTVRLLALPMAGRDGYREEWRPTT